MQTIESITELVNLNKAQENCFSLGERIFTTVSFHQKMTILKMYSILASITLDLKNSILSEEEMRRIQKEYSPYFIKDKYTICLYYTKVWKEIRVAQFKGDILDESMEIGSYHRPEIDIDVIIPIIALGKLIS